MRVLAVLTYGTVTHATSYLAVESLYVLIKHKLFIRLAKCNCAVRCVSGVVRGKAKTNGGIISTNEHVHEHMHEPQPQLQLQLHHEHEHQPTTHPGTCRHTRLAVNPRLLH